MSANPGVQLRSVLGPAKFNYWYETIIDLMIANPDMHQGERVRLLGRSQPWLSLIENSQSFRERYALRRAEHSKRISEHVEDKLHAATSLALDKLVDALQTKDVKPELALQATDTLLQRLGYTGKPAQAQQTQGNGSPIVVQIVNPVSHTVLQAAQGSIRSNEEASLRAHQLEEENRPKLVSKPAEEPAHGAEVSEEFSRDAIDIFPVEVQAEKGPAQDDPALRGDGEKLSRSA